jgi:hypothetical protein
MRENRTEIGPENRYQRHHNGVFLSSIKHYVTNLPDLSINLDVFNFSPIILVWKIF